MQGNTTEKVSAVDELISRQDPTDYLTELSLMHGAFIKSDFADDQRIRILVTNTFENLRDFIFALKTIQKNSAK